MPPKFTFAAFRARLSVVPHTSTPRYRRLVRVLATFLGFVVIATACSGEAPARLVQTPEQSIEEFSDDRAAGEPAPSAPPEPAEESATGPSDPVNVGAGNTVHVLGSIRSAPETGVNWEQAIPIIDGDLTTIASLSCDQGTACDADALALWGEDRVEVVNLATSANVLSQEELADASFLLNEVGITPIGFGENAASALEPAIIQSGTIRVAVHTVSIAALPDVTATDTTAGIVGPALFDDVIAAVAQSREDLFGTVVLVDFGDLDARAPGIAEIDAVDQLISAGADAVIGHGSDFLQRFDQIGPSVVSFGLGNAVSQTTDPLRLDSAVLRLEFARPGQSCLIPTTSSGAGPALDDPSFTSCGG